MERDPRRVLLQTSRTHQKVRFNRVALNDIRFEFQHQRAQLRHHREVEAPVFDNDVCGDGGCTNCVEELRGTSAATENGDVHAHAKTKGIR
jgi:hypothetical protein